MVRYALIALAICAGLLALWGAWFYLQWVEPPYLVVAMFVALALAMPVAAVGMVRHHAWGAYLFGVSAFLMTVPIFGMLMLSFVAWDVSTPQPPWTLIFLGLLALAIWAGVMAIRVGRSLRASVPE